MTSTDLAILGFACASPAHQECGLLGWLALRHGELLIDGVALRRTRDGRLALSWPARRDRSGRDHPVVCPIDDVARRAVEDRIIDALGEEVVP